MDVAVDISGLLDRFGQGSVAAAARLITLVENGGDEAEAVMDRVFPMVRDTRRIGFTGPPGAGKSTIVSKLSKLFRERERTIGIIAVDPTSPFSGGALLGDRIRMQQLSGDPEIFVRSLASRGSLGGISNCTDEVADLLDAFGKDLILIETVGVGQSELEIAEKTHTVVVILVPESGDGIQAMKAGLMEIGDIFVMNKSDHPDAEFAARELEDVIRIKEVAEGGWRPPVVLASALRDRGIDELLDAIDRHHDHLETNDLFRKKRRKILRSRVRAALLDRLEKRFLLDPGVRRVLDERMEEVYRGKLSPYRLVSELNDRVKIDR